MDKNKKRIVTAILLPVLILFAVIYYRTDPIESIYFPKCMIRTLTGYDCPGCGSQRAIHHLLHLNIGDALRANALVVVMIPYISAGLWFEYAGKKEKYPVAYRRIFGRRMMLIVLIAIIAFTVIRNIV